MSSIPGDREINNLAATLRHAFTQLLKGINTVTPGIVQAYNPRTRRAVVKCALNVITTDGARVERPLVAQVPVVFPTGGSTFVHVMLAIGDPILLLYSQRGLNAWKETHGQADPDEGAFFEEFDAIAIPGFGPAVLDLDRPPNQMVDLPLNGSAPSTRLASLTINGQTFVDIGVDITDTEVVLSWLSVPIPVFSDDDRLRIAHTGGPTLLRWDQRLRPDDMPQSLARNGSFYHSATWRTTVEDATNWRFVVREYAEFSVQAGDTYLEIGSDGVRIKGGLTIDGNVTADNLP